MKNFFLKIFLFICAVIFLTESALLFLVYFGRISFDHVAAFFTLYGQTPGRAGVLVGFAFGFLCIGLIFLFRVSRTTRKIHTLFIKDKGEIVRIPVGTIKDFIIQIIEKNSHLSDIDVVITRKRKWIYINVLCAYTGYTPIRSEINEMKEILRGEIKRVFEFPYLKIDFQLVGIRVDYEEYPETAQTADKDIVEEEDVLRETQGGTPGLSPLQEPKDPS